MKATRDSFLAYARAREKNIISLIRQLVECESPSDDSAALDRFVSLMSPKSATPRGRGVIRCPRINLSSVASIFMSRRDLAPTAWRVGVPGHPRLDVVFEKKTWMAGTRSAMTMID